LEFFGSEVTYNGYLFKGPSSDLMTITSAGNVGIGTSSPAYKLSVESTSDADLVQVQSTAGSNNTVLRLGVSGDDAVISGSGGSTGNLAFKTYGTERMRIDSSGNLRVGVGNTFEPTIQFTNSGRVEGSPGYSFSGDLDTGMFNPSTQGTIAFANNGSESMRITSTGLVGIGRSTNLRDRLTVNGEDTTTTFGATTAAVDITNKHASSFGGYTGVNFRIASGTYNESLAAIQAQYTAYSGNTMGGLVFGTRGASTTNVTEAMRIDSSQNLLVGKTSTAFGTAGVELKPSGETYVTRASATPLYVRRNTNNGDIVQFWKDTSAVGSIGTWDQSGSSRISMTNPNGNGFGIFRDSSTVAQIVPMNTAGNGDAAHSLGRFDYRWKDLYLSGEVNITDASSPTIRLIDSTNTNTLLMYAQNSTSHIGTYSNHPLVFDTNSTEACRIDGSGNLLVGRASNFSGAKAEIQTSDDVTTLTLNKNNANDGEILRFAKSGSPVGSIGTIGGEIYIESGDVGLQFDASGNDIVPYGGGFQDAAIDLGSSSNRFKDLYLSGGAYLGGVAAANKLDDYEEGTWTPTFLNGTSITYNSRSGTYTKIGNVVHVTASIDVSNSDTSDGSGITIGGLPFNASNDTMTFTLGRYRSFLATKGAVVIGAVANSSFIQLFEGNNDFILYSEIGSSGVLYFSGTYRV